MPVGSAPPQDDPLLPHCLWTVAAAAPGRVEDPEIATPCMGLDLDNPEFVVRAAAADLGPGSVEQPGLGLLGEVNMRAYDDPGMFGPLVGALRDERVRTHGLRADGGFVCVPMTVQVGDDISIEYVATEAAHRGRGLARQLLPAAMAKARDRGALSASLLARADGLPAARLPPCDDPAGLFRPTPAGGEN